MPTLPQYEYEDNAMTEEERAALEDQFLRATDLAAWRKKNWKRSQERRRREDRERIEQQKLKPGDNGRPCGEVVVGQRGVCCLGVPDQSAQSQPQAPKPNAPQPTQPTQRLLYAPGKHQSARFITELLERERSAQERLKKDTDARREAMEKGRVTLPNQNLQNHTTHASVPAYYRSRVKSPLAPLMHYPRAWYATWVMFFLVVLAELLAWM